MKKITTYLLLACIAVLFIGASRLHAQAPAIEWQNTLGGSNYEYGYGNLIQPTADRGYIVGGISVSPAGFDKTQNSKGDYDYWIVKLDALGNKVWDKTIGSTGYDNLNSIASSPDGGFLLAGYTNSNAGADKSENSKGGYDYWLVKIDSLGNILWDKTIGGMSDDYYPSIINSSNGGYVLAGISYSSAGADKSENSKGGSDYWVVKIDSVGNILWDKTIGSNGYDESSNIANSDDGGYLIAGISDSNAGADKSENSKGGSDYWIVRIDSVGNILWDKTIGGTGADSYSSITSSSDGGYVLAGSSYSNAGADKSEDAIMGPVWFLMSDYWIIKIDASGNILWDRTIGGTSYDNNPSIFTTNDGAYVMVGYSFSNAGADKSENNKGGGDYWVVEIDSMGNILWDKTIGSSGEEQGSSITIASDGGIVVHGSSSTLASANGDKSEAGNGSYDYWVVKLEGSCIDTDEDGICDNDDPDDDNDGCLDADDPNPLVDDTPVAICKDVTIALDQNGQAVITPQYIDNGSNDCGPITLSIDIEEFNCAHMGPNNVTLTVTDAQGNASSCIAIVTVEDNLPPVLSNVPANPVEFLITQRMTCDLDVDFSPLGISAADNCSSNPVITFDPPSGTFWVGTHTITVASADEFGNTGTSQFDLVINKAKPFFSITEQPELYTDDDEVEIEGRYSNQVKFIEVNWGDGSPNQAVEMDDDEFETEYEYRTTGIYEITLFYTDICDRVFTELITVNITDDDDEEDDDEEEDEEEEMSSKKSTGGSDSGKENEPENGFGIQYSSMELYPTPFSETLNVEYVASTTERVRVSLYNQSGFKVSDLHVGNVEKGRRYHWSHTPDSKLRSGVYLIRIQGRKTNLVKRIVYKK